MDVRLNTRVGAAELAGFDAVVLATGIRPRKAGFEGHEHPKVVSYIDVLTGKVQVGAKAAIVGAGGIGFDVGEFLVHAGLSPSLDPKAWMAEWGVRPDFEGAGGLAKPHPEAPAREGWLLPRSQGRPGARLDQTEPRLAYFVSLIGNHPRPVRANWRANPCQTPGCRPAGTAGA